MNPRASGAPLIPNADDELADLEHEVVHPVLFVAVVEHYGLTVEPAKGLQELITAVDVGDCAALDQNDDDADEPLTTT